MLLFRAPFLRGLAPFALAFSALACKMQSDEFAGKPGPGVGAVPVQPGAVAAGDAPRLPGPTAQAVKAGAPVGKGPVRFVRAPEGDDVAALVRSAMSSAQGEGRRVLVYAGATWCEPCQRFHAAALRGELDSALPGLTLLEFDVDEDRERLVVAGYTSKYIPLFAVPGDDGKATGKQIEGGVKGDYAVVQLTPRLVELVGSAGS